MSIYVHIHMYVCMYVYVYNHSSIRNILITNMMSILSLDATNTILRYVVAGIRGMEAQHW